MNKTDYRYMFKDMSSMIKFSYILKVCEVDNGAFSRFMNGQDNAISLDNCMKIYSALGILLQNSYNIHYYQDNLIYSYC